MLRPDKLQTRYCASKKLKKKKKDINFLIEKTGTFIVFTGPDKRFVSLSRMNQTILNRWASSMGMAKFEYLPMTESVYKDQIKMFRNHSSRICFLVYCTDCVSRFFPEARSVR